MKDLLHIALNDGKLILGIGINKKPTRPNIQNCLEHRSRFKVEQNFFRTISKLFIGSVVFYCSEETPTISSSTYIKQLKKITHNGGFAPIEREPSDRLSKHLEDVFTRMQNVEYVDSPNDPLKNWSEGISTNVDKKDLSPSAVRWNEFVKEKSFGTKLIPFEL